MIQIFQKIIPTTLQNHVDDAINNDMFPWFFMDSIRTQREYTEKYLEDIPRWDMTKVVDSFGLIHLVAINNERNSPYYDMCRTILYFLEEKANIEINDILRIRIRRTMRTPDTNESTYNTPHVDLLHDRPFYTFVYYVEESDGQTIFFNETYKQNSKASLRETPQIIERVPHKKGNGVLFDGFRYHAGNSPQKFVKRTVSNFDFTIREQ